MSIFYCCGDRLTETSLDGPRNRIYVHGRLEQMVLEFLGELGLAAFPDYMIGKRDKDESINWPSSGGSEYMVADASAIRRQIDDAYPEVRAFLLKMLEEWDLGEIDIDKAEPESMTVEDLDASFDGDCRAAARIQVDFEEPAFYRDDEYERS